SWWSPGSSPPGWALRSRAPPTRTTAPSRRPSWPRRPRDGSAGPAGPPSASGGSWTGCAGGTPRSGRIRTAAADRALGPRQHSACVQQHLLTVRAEALQEMPFDRYDSRNGSVGEQPLTDRGEVGALPDEPLHDGLRADLPCPALALVPALPGGEHVHLLMGEPAVVGVVARRIRVSRDSSQISTPIRISHSTTRIACPPYIRSTGSPSTTEKFHPKYISIPGIKAGRKTTNPMAVPHMRTTKPTMMPVAEVYSARPTSPNRPRWPTSPSISSARSASSCREW